jgi:putative DNA primase/helicase
LTGDDERPWAAYGPAGKPITDRQVANLLKPFEIFSRTVRIGDETLKGYQRAHFAEAWRRYLKATKPLSRPKSTSQTSQRR